MIFAMAQWELNLKCSVCGGQMRHLWTSWFCPQNCDKKKRVVIPPAPQKEEEDPECHAMAPSSPPCPQCKSLDTDPFAPVSGYGGVWPYTTHCWDCGSAW